MVDFFIDQLVETSQASRTLELLLQLYPDADLYTWMLSPGLLYAHPHLSDKKVVSVFPPSEHALSGRHLWWMNLNVASLNQLKPRPLIYLTYGFVPRFRRSGFTGNGKQDLFYLHHVSEAWPSRFQQSFHGQVWQYWKQRQLQKIEMTGRKQLWTTQRSNSLEQLPPFFPSKNYPPIEMVLKREGIVLLASGATENQLHASIEIAMSLGLKLWVFGGSAMQKHYYEHYGRGNLRWEIDFCEATLQAAFLQSRLTISWELHRICPLVLAALSCNCPLAVLESSFLSSIIPKGLAHRLGDFSPVEDLKTIMGMLSLGDESFGGQLGVETGDLAGEARRFALRYNEKNFLARFKNVITLLRDDLRLS